MTNYGPQPGSGSGVTSITAGTGLSGGTITTSGTIAISSTAVTAASYTLASVTVNARGQLTAASSGVLPNYMTGLTLSNDSSTPNSVLDIAAGFCADSTNAIMVTGTAFTKSTAGAWAAGSGSHAMGNGLTIADSTWYHVFAIINSGAFDVYFDTSTTAANKPSGTTAFRRIGSFSTNGSAQIIAFVQTGNLFYFFTPIPVLSGSSPGSNTAQTVAVVVPVGIVSQAILIGNMFDGTNGGVLYISSLALADVAAGGPITCQVAISVPGSWAANVITNTAQQIRYRFSQTTSQLSIDSLGWVDISLRP